MHVKGLDVVSAVDGLALGKVMHMQCTRCKSQNSSWFCSVCLTRSLHVDIVLVRFMTFGVCEWGGHRPDSHLPGVEVSWDCRNKAPQAGWLKGAEMHRPVGLQTGSLKSRCGQGRALSESLSPPPSFWWFLGSWLVDA